MSIINPQQLLEKQIAELSEQAQDQRDLAVSCQDQSRAALAAADDIDKRAAEFQAALDLLTGDVKATRAQAAAVRV